MTMQTPSSEQPLRIFGLEDFLSHPESIISHLNEPEGGLLLLDKPYALPSFSGVHRVRKLLSDFSGEKRVKTGHGGTLDPLATGLLVIATRKATKQLHTLLHETKTYEVTVRFGITSPSFDLETPIRVLPGIEQLRAERVTQAILELVGEHEQVPPIYSAVKIKGKPVYKHARKGRTPELAPKSIVITDIGIINIALPYATFSVTCSKGTYIRSLARDLGEQLGVGSVVTELRRTRIGDFSVEYALTFDMLHALRNFIPREVAEHS